MGECTPEDDAHQVYTVHVYVYHGVIACPEAHLIWVLLQADGSQWFLVTLQVQHVYGFLPWMRQLLLAHCVMYVRSTQSTTWFMCGKVPQTTVKSSNRPSIHCAQHVQQSVDMSIQLPAGLQCKPSQMAELQQQVQDAWAIYRRMTFSTYDRLHVTIHACVVARGSYTVYWCLGTAYCDVSIWTEFIIIYSTPTTINYLSHQFAFFFLPYMVICKLIKIFHERICILNTRYSEFLFIF